MDVFPRTRNLLFNMVFAINIPVVDLMLFLDTFSFSLSCAIMPRFIISIRELYDRDLRNRWQGIDTGFGVFSQTITNGDTATSTIALGDVSSGEGQGVMVGNVDDSEGIELEVVRGGACRV